MAAGNAVKTAAALLKECAVQGGPRVDWVAKRRGDLFHRFIPRRGVQPLAALAIAGGTGGAATRGSALLAEPQSLPAQPSSSGWPPCIERGCIMVAPCLQAPLERLVRHGVQLHRHFVERIE